jgi:hypothetical protein
MDPRVQRLRTPEACERFSRNATDRNRPDLAQAARRRAIDLRGLSLGAKTEVEKDAFRAVCAYEEVLTKKNGRRTRASRTWHMIDRYSVVGAIERAVDRNTATTGYRLVVDMGLQEPAFEEVVLCHPCAFSEEARARARAGVSSRSAS